jgi:hypothetical protein
MTKNEDSPHRPYIRRPISGGPLPIRLSKRDRERLDEMRRELGHRTAKQTFCWMVEYVHHVLSGRP